MTWNFFSSTSTITFSMLSREIHGQLRTDYPPALETENFETTVGPKLVILLNYLAILMKTESVSLLRNSYPIKEYAFYLKLFLSAKDLEKINNGVTNSIYKVPILSYGKHKSTVEYVNKEVIYVLQQDAKPVIREEEQSLGTIDEQSESHKDEQSLQLSKASDRTAQRKREREMKKAKSEQQRKALSAKRAEVSYQRKFLYQLIQSDEISDIFNAKAGHVNETVNPNWESSKEDRLIGSAKEYEKILASMSQTMDKAEDDD